MYFSGSDRVSSAMAFWIMPTWGPLPWAMTTWWPCSIRSTMALAVCLTAAICSGRLLPRALPPRAMTMRFPIPSYLWNQRSAPRSSRAFRVAWGSFTLARKIMAAMM